MTVTVSNEINSKAKDKADSCIYIGPTILGVIQNGTIYKGDAEEVKELIAPAIGMYPDIVYLLANDCEVAKKRKEIKTEGNFLNIVYKKLTKH